MYSLEQCGILLRDAVGLFKSRSYANAIVLAAFAREELGRASILQDLRAEVLGDTTVTLKQIKERCGDHVTKQTRGQLSITQRATGEEGLAKLIRSRIEIDPQSPEYQRASDELDRVTKLQHKRTPHDRHELRMSSLYVEPTDTGTGWNRPQQKSQSEAQMFLTDAVGDYAGQHDRFQKGSLEYIDPEMFQALRQWSERPQLPEPTWP
jgi:AbiV family abortive infection protein